MWAKKSSSEPIAELGDKTQLTTLLFASDTEVNKGVCFWAASGAIVLSNVITVLVDAQLSSYTSPGA